MILKGLRDEDFTQYKKPSMFLIFPSCSFKCCREGGFPVETCQNCELVSAPNIKVSPKQLVDRYIKNHITSAIVCGGMEPFDSWGDLQELIIELRNQTNDDCVIYTGYYPEEIQDKIEWLKQFQGIVCKFGRYIPNQQPHFDETLGVMLASSNQYARKIS